MANTIFQGVGCSWGVAGACTALGTFKVQSADVTLQGNEAPILDGDGDTVGWVGYDPNDTATFTYVATDATAIGTATVTTPDFGEMIEITSGKPAALTAANWIVKNVSIRATNTSATVIDLQLQKWAGITA